MLSFGFCRDPVPEEATEWSNSAQGTNIILVISLLSCILYCTNVFVDEPSHHTKFAAHFTLCCGRPLPRPLIWQVGWPSWPLLVGNKYWSHQDRQSFAIIQSIGRHYTNSGNEEPSGRREVIRPSFRILGLSHYHGFIIGPWGYHTAMETTSIQDWEKGHEDQSYVLSWKVDIYVLGLWGILFPVYPCYCRIEEMPSRPQIWEIHVTSKTAN